MYHLQHVQSVASRLTMMSELKEEKQLVSKKKVDLQKQCERQELERYRALEGQCEKWKEERAEVSATARGP